MPRSGKPGARATAAFTRNHWSVDQPARGDIEHRGAAEDPGGHNSSMRNAMHAMLKCALAVAAVTAATHAGAQVSLYEDEGFAGRSFTTERPVSDLGHSGFNDRASSVVVLRDRWEICDDAQYRGRCMILKPGRYPSLASMGLNDTVSSVRTVSNGARYDDNRYAPAPMAVYDDHRRTNERVYEASVTSVRAVVGPPEQRCWVEREQVAPEHGGASIPGAIVGAVIGGVLGHQVGGGRGQDVATVGGAVAGAAIGANVGSGTRSPQTRDVQRCANTASQSRPDYWDVTYNFRGTEHRMQTTTPPGPTITVNGRGEPRA
jgi:uncharacterized protein YcfJ